jgi:hypothetical protein
VNARLAYAVTAILTEATEIFTGLGMLPYESPAQLRGARQAAWDFAPGPTITADDASAGIQAGTVTLDRGFFKSRWDRATPSERGYMTAMATDGGGPSISGEIARRLVKRVTAVGPTRAGLIHKGHVCENNGYTVSLPTGLGQRSHRVADMGALLGHLEGRVRRSRPMSGGKIMT